MLMGKVFTLETAVGMATEGVTIDGVETEGRSPS